jgi:hypothetical protein
MDEWMLRELPELFFKLAGKHSEDQNTKLFTEIPDEHKPLAYTIIHLAIKFNKCRCREFRQILFMAYKKMLDEDNLDIKLPYYWYADGVMIEPEWIVKITNGIIGWTCDDSKNKCLLCNECRFYIKD